MMVSGYLVYAKYSSQDLLENYHHFNKVFKRNYASLCDSNNDSDIDTNCVRYI